MIAEINTQHCPADSPNRKLWLRQTPAGDGVWQDVGYSFAPETQGARWLIIIDQPLAASATTIPKERRIFFVTEPPEVTTYSGAFLNQFGFVVSPMHHPGYRGTLITSQPGLVWFYGSPIGADARGKGTTLEWQALAGEWPEKTANLSVICSNKARTTAQKQRLIFVNRLREEMAAEISFFGRGSNPISDKAEAIAPFRYHIVLENNRIDHFWTEKLADAYLGGSFPLYVGCRNLGAYFPENSFAYLEPDRPAESLQTIHRILDEDLWSRNQSSLMEARRRLMHDHNFFALATAIIRGNHASTGAPPLTRPERLLSSKEFGAARQLKDIVRKLFSAGTR